MGRIGNVLAMACVIAWAIPIWMSSNLTAGEPQDLEFVAECDGTVQRYVQILPPDFTSDKKVDLLVTLHGHGSDRWQFSTADIAEAKACRDFAEKHGMILISPDYRAKTSWMGPKAEADMLQLIAALKEEFSIQRVFIAGGSMGGTSSLTFTALHPDLISGVAAMNPTSNHLEYDRFQDAISESFGGDKATIPEVYKARSAEYWPERFTMPVGISTGGMDEIVPPDSTLRLAGILEKMKRPVHLIHRPEGGHSTTYEDAIAILEFMVTSKAN
ncbi:alpha/beta hydrolase family protein [Planctomicrobium sp. SH668]|uniref:alpha/beta hydrolase family protein n=1 Tax=Planctomicrobium sp. SH668 TaxID=3448126 RepID=UPI003F5B7807